MSEDEERAEVAEVILEVLSSSAENTITTALTEGSFTGDIGCRDIKNMDYSCLISMVLFFRTESEQLSSFGKLSVEATFLINIASAVVDARQAFCENDFSKGRNAIAILKESSEEFALPDALETEVDEMSKEISYRECLSKMKDALMVDQPIQYFISISSKSRKRTASTGRVHSASVLVTSQGSAGFAPLSEGEEVIADEDLMLNETLFESKAIEKALQQSSQVQDLLEAEELPEEFFHLISALEAIRNLRQAVKSFDWTAAIAALDQIMRGNLVELVPIIKDEVEAVKEPIHNYAVVTACKSALLKGQPTGNLGMLDYSTISLEPLESAIKLCESLGFNGSRAAELCKAVKAIEALRTAQKAHDWVAVRAALKQAESDGVGVDMTAMCLAEINRSLMECDNYDHVDALKGALIKEEIVTRESLLDLENATVNELTSIYAKASNFPEDTRGPILKTLMSLAEVVLKLRRAVIKMDWFLVESLMPVVKDYVESFQNDVERTDRVISQRKTVSYRASAVFRGSVLARSGGGSMVGGGVGGMSPEGAVTPSGSPVVGMGKAAVWAEFTELSQVIKRELQSIENHFQVGKLEINLANLMKEGGIQSEVIGTIDKALIKTEELAAALQEKADLEAAGLTLPDTIIKMGKIAQLVVEVRLAVLGDKWDTISAMLEETLNGGLGTLPEYTRGEILIVRRELENRWIISNLTNALQTGKLEGELGSARVADVSCEHLMSYISTVKSLNPRTDFAILLLHTAESICPLRKLLCQPEIDWAAVCKLAKKLLQDVQRQKIHPSVLPELRLVHATAEDTILCNSMRTALCTGGPSGEPGAIDITPVSTQALEAANKLVARSTLKTDGANHMANACRIIQNLREALLHLHSSVEDPSNVWSTVQSYLSSIEQTCKENPLDNAWRNCRDELDLLTKHVHIEEVRSRLLECTVKTSHTYAQRKDSTSLPSQTKESESSPEQTELFCNELDSVIEYAKALKFESEFLDRYVGCATTLRLLRSNIVKNNWAALEELLRDPSVRPNLKILREAEQELAWVACEFHNHRALEVLSAALKASSCIPEEEPTSEDTELILSASDFSANNDVLKQALQDVQAYKITSKSVAQLLDCCKNVLQLRQSLLNNNNDLVAEALHWFQRNYSVCPSYILREVQQAYVLHQNDLLARSLTAAIAVGKPLGPCGELRLQNIRTSHLEVLLNQASEIEPKFSNVEELCEAAAVAVSIRVALLDNDLISLSSIVDELSERDHFHLLVVDEIATARSEIDNDVTTRALMDSLKSFDDAESKAMDMTFMSSGGEPEADDGSTKSSPRPGFSILQTFSQRRYSFANKNNANIDPETIDIDVLEQGLRIAEDHGVFSSRARMLYRTVELVRSLRLAMKQSEWPRLEEILNHANFEENVGTKYDAVAQKEIQALTSQLEMRAAIVDLSKALKIGWAKCSTGIVDTSSLDNDFLECAIDRANRSIMELNAGAAHENNNDDGDQTEEEEDEDDEEGLEISALELAAMKRRVSFAADDPVTADKVSEEKSPSLVQKQVDLLMESARLALRIREILLAGDMETAGVLAEEALNGKLHYAVVDELKHYSKEINTALSTMKTFDALRAAVLAGNVEKLSELINHAKDADSHYTDDLGMVRALDRAEHVYYSLLEIRKRASALSDVYDTEALRGTIEQAVKYHMAESELEQTRSRLDKLLAFEALVEEITSRSHGVLADSASLEQILKHASQLNLSLHPLAKSAELRLRFVPEAFRTGVVAEGVIRRNLYVLATETIRMKRQYLLLASSSAKYALENYPNLRRPPDFGVRMNIASEELRRTMLVHSDQPLPTSLTKQSPILAALSVTVFTQYVRGIERNMFTEPGVVMRRLLELGRSHPPMRDEVLLLIIKQMRHNMDVDAVCRLWKCLSACLYHFPPSLLFESYLELFLLQSGTDSSHFIGYTQRCIRFMHQSIIQFGYDRKITVEYDKSLDEMKRWFQEGIYDPTLPLSQVTPPAASSSSSAASSSSSSSLANKSKVSADGAKAQVIAEGSLELSDPAFMTSLDKKPIAHVHGNAHSTLALRTGEGTHEVRGTREDWIARFRLFNHDNTSKEGGHMTKNKFAAAIASSIAPDAKLDQFDRDVFYFLLFGKHVSNTRAVVREFSSAEVLFHSTSEDEIGASQARRHWLDANTPTIDKSSELFFSQLKGPDLGSYAERFWDNIVEKMSEECSHFPFLKWEGDERRKPSIKNGGSDVTINWELYREIVLTGMKKYVERAKSVRATVTTSAHEDFKLTGFTMHHVDLQTRRK